MGKRAEILAPAGSRQALEAAVFCGADAVYLGVDCLNARRNAENFTLEGLAQVVRNCHIQGVKVYLTLNILVREKELGQLLEAAQEACRAGVDGVIVQDMGAVSILRSCCPGLRLSASTQMAVHNLEGAKRLEDLGFSRVVLARECSREEIARITADTKLEVEVFVHGALCMCVSGQCYMSSVLGQRSGNRGLCAQPCRLDFQTPGASHALSLKDLCLIPKMRQLIDAGVTSLKIEGRMKRPEYVAAAVTACRKAMDGEPVDLDELQAVFSRSGFTDGYFTGRRDLSMFGFRQKEDVTAAAGVLKKLENLYTDPRKRIQKVETEFSFAMKKGHPAFLSVLDEDGNSLCVEGDIPQQATHKPTDQERAMASLSKTGGTPYHVKWNVCEIDPGLMLPASSLNALRREALAQLDQERGQPREIPFQRDKLPVLVKHPGEAREKPALRLWLDRQEQLTARMLEQAELVTLPVDQLEELCADGLPVGGEKLCVGLPRMMFEGQGKLKERLEKLKKAGIRHASVGNLGTIELASQVGFRLHGEPFLNAINSYTLGAYQAQGLEDLCVSFELNLEETKALQRILPLGVLAYGALPLMTMRNCPVKAGSGCAACKRGEGFVTDRRGAKLFTSCAYGCAELLNPIPLYMGDRLKELTGLDFYVMRFTTETPQTCRQIFQRFQAGEKWPGEFTRGLLYKELL